MCCSCCLSFSVSFSVSLPVSLSASLSLSYTHTPLAAALSVFRSISWRLYLIARRRRGTGGAAPKSPSMGIGQPRVSPEVAAADQKKKADSLKNAKFDVDFDLFGDAGEQQRDRGSRRSVMYCTRFWLRQRVGMWCGSRNPHNVRSSIRACLFRLTRYDTPVIVGFSVDC